MTVIVDIITGTGQDLRWATLYNLFANSLIQNGGSSTQFVAVDTGAFNGEDADIQFVVQGSGFTYSGSFPNIELTGGTIESFSLQTEAGVELASFTGFSIDAITFTAALDAYTAGGPSNPDPSALDAIFKALQYDTVGGAGNDLIEGNILDALPVPPRIPIIACARGAGLAHL